MKAIDNDKLIHEIAEEPYDGFAGYTFCCEDFHWPESDAHPSREDGCTTEMEAVYGEDDGEDVVVTCIQCLATTQDAAIRKMEHLRDFGR